MSKGLCKYTKIILYNAFCTKKNYKHFLKIPRFG